MTEETTCPALVPILKNSGILPTDNLIHSWLTESTDISSFPVLALPTVSRDFVNAYYETFGFPTDFVATACIVAVAAAVGNTYQVSIKTGWDEPLTIYACSVGRPGTSKTHAMAAPLKKIEEIDNQLYERYLTDRKAYELMNKAKKEEAATTDPPTLKKTIVKDFTPEVLAKRHSENRKGLLILADELDNFLESFTRYSTASAQSMYLSIWSGSPVVVDRMKAEPLHISNPAISIIGGIQPDLLKKLAANNRDASGFLDRFLFAYPDNPEKKPFTDSTPDPDVLNRWSGLIGSLVANHTMSTKLTYTGEAKQLMVDWQNSNLTVINDGTPVDASIRVKIESYCIRLSGIFHLMKSTSDVIERDSVAEAISVSEYYYQNALKIRDCISLHFEKTDKMTLYNSLPQSFTTAMALECAKVQKCNLSKRSINTFLKEKSLFKRLAHGQYEKAIVHI